MDTMVYYFKKWQLCLNAKNCNCVLMLINAPFFMLQERKCHHKRIEDVRKKSKQKKKIHTLDKILQVFNRNKLKYLPEKPIKLIKLSIFIKETCINAHQNSHNSLIFV